LTLAPQGVTRRHPKHGLEKRETSRRPSGSGFWHQIVRARAGGSILLALESIGLIALSATDLLVTYALLRRGPSFYESNPVARWLFRRWDMAGMTLFKFSALRLVIIIGEYVERRDGDGVYWR